MDTFDKETLVQNVLMLYQCKADNNLLDDIYADVPSFEDPISHAIGRAEVWAQWYSMPKAFSNSITNSYTIVKNEQNLLEFSLDQTYTFRLTKNDKRMLSKVVLVLDDNGKVVSHKDLWNGKPLKKWYHFIRRLMAKIIKLWLRPKV